MGCDVHVCIDYDHFYQHSKPMAFQFASPFISRNYHLFGLLAGVRTEGPPVVEPRGFPERMSWNTEDAAYLSVTDSSCKYGGCRVITPTEAEDYVRRGIGQRVDKWHMTNSDHHTASWLTTPVLRSGFFVSDEDKEGRSRFVFWFDN